MDRQIVDVQMKVGQPGDASMSPFTYLMTRIVCLLMCHDTCVHGDEFIWNEYHHCHIMIALTDQWYVYGQDRPSIAMYAELHHLIRQRWL